MFFLLLFTSFYLGLSAQQTICIYPQSIEGKANQFSFNLVGLDTTRSLQALQLSYPARFECFWEFGDGESAITYSQGSSPFLQNAIHIYPPKAAQYKIKAYIRSAYTAQPFTKTIFDTTIVVATGDWLETNSQISAIPNENITLNTTADLAIMPQEKMLADLTYYSVEALEKGYVIVGYGNKSCFWDKEYKKLAITETRPAYTKEKFASSDILSENNQAAFKDYISSQYQHSAIWAFDKLDANTLQHIYLTLYAPKHEKEGLDKPMSDRLDPNLSVLILSESHEPIVKKNIAVQVVSNHAPNRICIEHPHKISRYSFENEGIECSIYFQNDGDTLAKNILVDFPYKNAEKARIKIIAANFCENGECIKWKFSENGIQFYTDKAIQLYSRRQTGIPDSLTKGFIRFNITSGDAQFLPKREDMPIEASILFDEKNLVFTNKQKVYVRDSRWGARVAVNSIWFTNKVKAPFQLLIPSVPTKTTTIGETLNLFSKQLNISAFYNFKLYPYNTYMSNRVELGVGTAFPKIAKQTSINEAIPSLPAWVKRAKYYEYDSNTAMATYINALYFKSFFVPSSWGTFAQANVGTGLGTSFGKNQVLKSYIPISAGIELGALRKQTGYMCGGFVPSIDMRFNYFAYLGKKPDLNPWNMQVGLLWRVF